MQFSPLVLLLGVTIPSVVAGMLRLTVAELLYTDTVVLLRAILVAMTNPTQQSSWGVTCSGPRCDRNAGSCSTV